MYDRVSDAIVATGDAVVSSYRKHERRARRPDAGWSGVIVPWSWKAQAVRSPWPKYMPVNAVMWDHETLLGESVRRADPSVQHTLVP